MNGGAIVTGAGSPTGIGFAVARALGSLGVPVVISSTTDRIHARAEELRALGYHVYGVVADLTARAGVDSVVQQALQDLPAITILVNNAGMVSVETTTIGGDVVETDDDSWTAGLERNLTTAFHMCRAVVPHMRRNSYGRIVNVASVTGPVMAMRAEVVYGTAKAGLVGLSRAIAVDEAAYGITCNVVSPGWIATGSQTDHEAAQGMKVPVGRSGTPEEVAHVISMLCAADAGYLTGQVITVDGGNSIAEER